LEDEDVEWPEALSAMRSVDQVISAFGAVVNYVEEVFRLQMMIVFIQL
jgi:hypothetical protein